MSTKSKPLATVVVLTIIFVLPILIRGAANDVTPVHTSVTEETSVVMEGPKEVETTSTIVSDVSEETTEETSVVTEEPKEVETTSTIVSDVSEETTEETSEGMEEPQEVETIPETHSSKGKPLGVCKVTAYCPCSECSGEYGNITSCERTAIEGRTVACNSLPKDSIVEINGHQYVVEDVGRLQYMQFDIYFESHEDADDFGVQYIEVYRIE